MEPSPQFCAADAFADASGAGIGGWWLPEGAGLEPGNVQWFSMQLQRGSLPEWFQGSSSRGLQELICFLEALAQLALLVLRLESSPAPPFTGCTLMLRQLCDNIGVVHATAKNLSQKEPLCYVLQALGFHSSRLGVSLATSHVAGVRNEWADALSRDRLEGFNPSLRCSVDLCALLRAPWLQNTTLEVGA